MAFNTFFSGGQIDRAVATRGDSDALLEAWHSTEARIVAVWQSRCLVHGTRAILLTRQQLGDTATLDEAVYLGSLENRQLFALPLPDDLHAVNIDAAAFENFRGLLSQIDEQDAALLAYAKGMIEWRCRHRHCGACGAANQPLSGGFVMACTRADCGNRSFPRIDPAIIVLVVDRDDPNRCLLGRQHSWPEGRYSTIAGFVEPGESLEDAVAREVMEETNIEIADCNYMGSQPWPFPTGMMVGFHAVGDSTRDICRHDKELADARWFSRDAISSGDIVLPPPTSIAFRLIEHWFNQWDGAPLDSFGLSGDFSRRTGERT